jgi:hypothetical protein
MTPYFVTLDPMQTRETITPLAAAGGPIPVDPCDVRRRDLLGGLIHEYCGLAA